MASAGSLLSELQQLQRLVASGQDAPAQPDPYRTCSAAGGWGAVPPLAPVPAACASDDEAEGALEAAREAAHELALLQREVAALRRQLRERGEEAERARAAAARERHEAALSAERLQVALLQQRSEVGAAYSSVASSPPAGFHY